MEVGDVRILEGNYSLGERPCIIIEAETAAQAISEGEATALLETALRALHLSGKAIVYASAQPPRENGEATT